MSGKHPKRVHRARNKERKSLVAFVLIGLFSDIKWLLGAIVKVIAWPTSTFAHWAANKIRKEVKLHPSFRPLVSPHAIRVASGLAILLVAFSLQRMFHNDHVVWDCSLEALKAGGVCPIWETVAAAFRRPFIG